MRLAGIRSRIMLGVVAVLLSATAFAALGDVRAEPGITAQRLWTFVHLLLFVFWLGADLGVVLAVRAAARPGLLPEQRWRTLGLARTIDLAPRLAASLMLTVGGILTEYIGIAHPWWQMAGVVVLGPVWMGLVFLAHTAASSAPGVWAERLEDGLRRLLIVAVPVSVAWSWFSGRLAPAPYVAAKLLLFALLMVLGLRIRTAWRELAVGLRQQPLQPIPAAGAGVAATRLNALVPVMLASWVALAAAAWLGISRPGEILPAAAISGLAGLRWP